jgi:hypothetical protein
MVSCLATAFFAVKQVRNSHMYVLDNIKRLDFTGLYARHNNHRDLFGCFERTTVIDIMQWHSHGCDYRHRGYYGCV